MKIQQSPPYLLTIHYGLEWVWLFAGGAIVSGCLGIIVPLLVMEVRLLSKLWWFPWLPILCMIFGSCLLLSSLQRVLCKFDKGRGRFTCKQCSPFRASITAEAALRLIVEVAVDRRQREQGGTGKIFLFLRTGEEIPLPMSQGLPNWQQRRLVKLLQQFLQLS